MNGGYFMSTKGLAGFGNAAAAAAHKLVDRVTNSTARPAPTVTAQSNWFCDAGEDGGSSPIDKLSFGAELTPAHFQAVESKCSQMREFLPAVKHFLASATYLQALISEGITTPQSLEILEKQMANFSKAYLGVEYPDPKTCNTSITTEI